MDFKAKIIFNNAIRGFLAGFFATAITVVVPAIGNLSQLGEWLFALALAGAVGGIVGLIQALNKYFTWKTDEEMLAEINSRINQ